MVPCRLGSVVCALLGLTCAVIALWSSSQTPLASEGQVADVPPRLEVINPVIELGQVPVGQTVTLDVRVVNRSSVAGRILNVSRSCDLGGCFDSPLIGPIEVAPGTTVTYPVLFVPGRLGPFEAHIRLYLDDGGVREVRVTVLGIGTTPEKGDDQKPAP